jgi:hypothetical protein
VPCGELTLAPLALPGCVHVFVWQITIYVELYQQIQFSSWPPPVLQHVCHSIPIVF